jgi:hypothetical protein
MDLSLHTHRVPQVQTHFFFFLLFFCTQSTEAIAHLSVKTSQDQPKNPPCTVALLRHRCFCSWPWQQSYDQLGVVHWDRGQRGAPGSSWRKCLPKLSSPQEFLGEWGPEPCAGDSLALENVLIGKRTIIYHKNMILLLKR